ncbi:MAG TPA: NAD(P)-dependent oxidoreductase [Mariprofundaceae bacterium]|nr:NAD(P)-dependent oxidoreductase [Mariprofundaceae bacterium]
MTPTIGFIGLGIMGEPMAANLLKAGHRLTVWNRTAAKAAQLVNGGAVLAATPRELAKTADVIIMMLTGPAAIEAVLTGPDGMLTAGIAGKTVINMSSIPPAYAREVDTLLRSQGATAIDAPVSGSRMPAEEGTLVILAGGDTADIERAEPLLLTMGKKVVHCGAAGQGSAMKMTVNLLLGTMMAGFAEAVNYGEKAGLDTATLLDTILAGPLGCGLYQLKRDMFVRHEYPPQFPYRHMAKDIGFILATATELQAPTPLGNMLAALYRPDAEAALADSDFAAVKRILEAMG